MADEKSTQEDEKSEQEGEATAPEGEATAPEGEAKPAEGEKASKETPKYTLTDRDPTRSFGIAMGPKPEVAAEPVAEAEPAPDADRDAPPAISAAELEKRRPGAFNAVFDKAREAFTRARDGLKDTIPLKALVLQDARPTLTDAGSERDRWVLKDGRALDGVVYLAVPVGKLEWHASFGRECVNYATVTRNTNKRQPIMPKYGDTVIAYVNTMVDGQTPALVEVDPTGIADVEAWVKARVEEMVDTIMRRRAVLAKKAAPPTST